MKRKQILLFFVYAILQSCGHTQTGEKSVQESIIRIAEEYCSERVDNSRREVAPGGQVLITNDKYTYVIDKARIYTGLIDGDEKPDAIVTLMSFNSQNLDLIEHLIIINRKGRLSLAGTYRSDIRISSIDGGIITAQMPKYPRDSPLFNCDECQDTVRLTFSGGTLGKVK